MLTPPRGPGRDIVKALARARRNIVCSQGLAKRSRQPRPILLLNRPIQYHLLLANDALLALRRVLEPNATLRLDKPEQSGRRLDSSDTIQTARTASGQSSRSSDSPDIVQRY